VNILEEDRCKKGKSSESFHSIPIRPN